MGFKFRRQEPIGPYIADFACIEKRVIVETDGDSHDNRRAYDARRDQWFLDHGWFVLRFWDDYVIEQTDDALEQIYLALTNPSAVTDPLNRGC
jgi:very-short-patch-repair endonuclease